ncbi:hypothetical protein [Mesorhizobium sp. M0037]|uniref:type II toxin-antitoxin system HicB family antitoxin n=1 Tax=unclassified Mesorhizobium TaxID=325217 RepID=UPI00333BD8AF
MFGWMNGAPLADGLYRLQQGSMDLTKRPLVVLTVYARSGPAMFLCSASAAADGETHEEALANTREAIAEWIEKRRGMEIRRQVRPQHASAVKRRIWSAP